MPRLKAPLPARVTLAALVGAACVVLAFPTVGLAVPVLFAWAPLLAVARDLSWRKRLLAGWLLGFGYQAVLFRWVSFTMQEMAGLSVPLAALCVVAFAAWHGLLGGVFLVAAEPARRVAAARAPWLGPLAVAVVYVAIEHAWPYVFPWGLGHAFWEIGPVHSAAAITGIEGLSLVVILVSAALAELWLDRHAGGRLALPVAAPALGLAALILLAGVGWWLHIAATPPERTLRVAAVQLNYTIEEKKHANIRQRRAFMERLDAALRAIPPDTYDLIVASEGAFPFYWDVAAADHPEAGTARAPFPVRMTLQVGAAIAEGPRTDLIIGGLRKPAPSARTRNSAVHFSPDGRIQGFYDKNVLVPFGEYLPGTSWFPSLAHSIKGISDFASGERPCAFEVDGRPVACGICYESILADYTRDTVGVGEVLVNLTIDVWFGASTAPWFHLMGQTSRAVELGVPLVRSALTGVSALVGPDGVAYATLPLDEAGVLTGEVPIRDLATPYRATGPLLRWLCYGLTLALLGLAYRRRRVLASLHPTVNKRGVAPSHPP